MKRGKGIKLGVIGAGVMGENHARTASGLTGAKLAAIADVDFARAKEVAEKYGAAPYPNHQEMLPQVDAVILATPAHAHLPIAQDCLKAEKHLLIEKPFTGSSSNARSLVALAKEKGLILAVGLIERFNPAFQKLARNIKGEKVIGLDFKRLSPFPERISDASVIFDMMLHDLDLLLALLPDEITHLRAKGEKVQSKFFDRVVATFAHKSGVFSRIEANRVFGSKTRKITVTTEKHLIEADLLNKHVYVRDFSSPIPSAIPVKPIDQLTQEQEDFIAAIKGKHPPLVTGDNGLKALILAEEVEKACF